ncbi:MAG: cyclic-di-AMP receptor [Clostridia bacterium]|nr:cyclic-di-AMP receptor [Clostridia bacterium]
MKLLLAIINNDDAQDVNYSLSTAGYAATKISSTGGFLMSGNTTFLIGVPDESVDDACRIISEHSEIRTQSVPSITKTAQKYVGNSEQVTVGGATVFILTVDELRRL